MHDDSHGVAQFRPGAIVQMVRQTRIPGTGITITEAAKGRVRIACRRDHSMGEDVDVDFGPLGSWFMPADSLRLVA